MSGQMASTMPKLRGACEFCHKRKIRCVMKPGDEQCQTCANNHVPCLFAPRSKPGRVSARRENDIGRGTTDEHFPYADYTALAQMQPQIDMVIPMSSAHTSAGSDMLADAAINAAWDRDTPLISDMDRTEYFTQWAPSHSQTCPPLLSPTVADPIAPRMNDGNPPRLQPSDAGQTSRGNIQIPSRSGLDESGAKGPSGVGRGAAVKYSTLLEACRSLHDLQNTDHSSSIPDDDFFELLAGICTAAGAEATPDSADGEATRALAQASVLKLLAYADAVTWRMKARGTWPQGPQSEDFFFLKKLDLALLRAKLALSHREGRATAVTKAKELHVRIQTIIDRDYVDWMWQD